MGNCISLTEFQGRHVPQCLIASYGPVIGRAATIHKLHFCLFSPDLNVTFPGEPKSSKILMFVNIKIDK